MCVNKFVKEFGFASVPIDAEDGANQLEANLSLKYASAYGIKNILRYLGLVGVSMSSVCQKHGVHVLHKVLFQLAL